MTEEIVSKIIFYGQLGSSIMGVLTAFNIFLSIRTSIEERKMRRQRTDPKIAVNIVQNEYNPYILTLVIENVGNSPAHNIKFDVQQELDIDEEKKIGNIEYIKNGFRSLNKKTKRETVYLRSFDVDAKIFKTPIKIGVEYEDISGRKFKEKEIIDLSYLVDATFVNNLPSNKIVHELAGITEALEHISQNLTAISTAKKE